MFDLEQKFVEDEIKKFVSQNDLPDISIQWNWIPFSGHWGISTSLFSLAAAEARQKNIRSNVPLRAGELADLLVEFIGQPKGFEKLSQLKVISTSIFHNQNMHIGY